MSQPLTSFRHEALMYAGDAEFLAGTVPFILDGLTAGEPILVVERPEKADLLRAELGVDADAVQFADMLEVGANPARIIPAWHDFVARHGGPGRPVRGIGEPIWRGRGPAELTECQRHESLLNVAFAPGAAWWLLCPYDTVALAPVVIDEARRSHPFISERSAHGESDDFRGLGAPAALLDAPLAAPPRQHYELAFGPGGLVGLREFVAAHTRQAGFGADRVENLVLAVSEVAANSVRHGGGRGVLRLWQERDAFVCEVRDRGNFDRPLVDRVRPGDDPGASRGLWLANHLCDLVQIRSLPSGTVVRLHLRNQAA
ncbi:MAG: sensor histidine kinase [Candidatus Dormibacteraeota bacterium]|nr:sensor histidine kinase [Candidatus Dormibacteraeota bacterium]